MNKSFRRVFSAVVLLGAGSCIANASSISYYVDVFSTLTTTGQLCSGPCPTATGYPATLNNGTASTIALTLPQFNQNGNAAEGTPSANHIFVLTNVALALDWKMLGNVNIYNFNSAAVAYNYAEAFANMTLTAFGTQTVAPGTASAGSGSVPGNGGGPFSLTTFNGVTGTGNISQNAAAISAFEGFADNTFAASLHTNAVGVAGQSDDPNAGFLAYNGTGQMGAIATITYTYTEQAIPEPGTLTLMGGALIGLGCLVRRKRTANR